VRHHDLVASHSELLLACVGAGRRENMAFKVTFLPGQRDAFVCTYQDGHVRLFDLRLRASSGCGVQKVCSLGPAVLATSLAFHPGVPSLFALGAEPDPLIRLLDLRRGGGGGGGSGAGDGSSSSATGSWMAQPVLAFAPPDVTGGGGTDGVPMRRRRRHGASGVDFAPTGELGVTYRDGPAVVFDTRGGESGGTSADGWPVRSDALCTLSGGHRNSKTFLKESQLAEGAVPPPGRGHRPTRPPGGSRGSGRSLRRRERRPSRSEACRGLSGARLRSRQRALSASRSAGSCGTRATLPRAPTAAACTCTT
jgi:hypothetical protein